MPGAANRAARGGERQRLRLLYVVRTVPHVPAPGGLTRSFHMVRAAAQVCDVTLVSVEDDPGSARLDQMEPLCAEITLLSPARQASPAARPAFALPRPIRRTLDSLDVLIHPEPYPATGIDGPALRQTVRRLLRTRRYDGVVIEYAEIAGLLGDVLREWGGPRVADFQNVDSVLAQRTQRMLQGNRRRPSISGARLVRQLRRVEERILRAYTRITATSAVDAAHLHRIDRTARVNVVPNGVDVDYFSATAALRQGVNPIEAGREILVFTGSLWHHPNKDALSYFIGDVWPLIRSRRPYARFWIVGAAPVPDILRPDILPRGIEVFTSVADVRPYLAQASVAVVPLRLGSGTRLKILEALAANLPVVSTTLGAEGLDLEPGRDLLLRDDARAFGDAVVSLLERPDDARVLAQHGGETVRSLYNWDHIAAHFQALLLEMGMNNAGRPTQAQG